MRGQPSSQSSMLCLLSLESRVPADHPLRAVKRLADEALEQLGPVFDQMYSEIGRPSIPPEWLLKASLLMALYSVRSERLLCEQLDYNLLFRWFLDMDMVQQAFDHSVFSKNRQRLMEHEVAGQFFAVVVEQAQTAGLMSREHFTVDGTLIQACASMKSFRPKGEEDRPASSGSRANRWVDFHGEKRSNETHESKTDPEAKLMRKGLGKEAKLSFSAHALMENRNGLLVDLRIAEANGRAEREVALQMLDQSLPGQRRLTLGGDKGYDFSEFVRQCRDRNVTPHVSQRVRQYGCRGSAVDGRTTAHPGYAVSQRIRKRVEEIFGWAKTVGQLARTRLRGIARTQYAAYLVGAAYNLLRMARMLPAPP
jgi:transposase